jgi:hypothetical protein
MLTIIPASYRSSRIASRKCDQLISDIFRREALTRLSIFALEHLAEQIVVISGILDAILDFLIAGALKLSL